MKSWEIRALALLKQSLHTLFNESNELDWKESLSPNHEKLSQHLCAFSNHPDGGYLVFGVNDKTKKPIGISAINSSQIISTLSNRARGSLTPEVKIEHSILNYEDHDLLFIFIHESTTKPVHLKKGSVEDSYIRSGGSTRRASRNELASLMLNSRKLRWEELNASQSVTETEVLAALDHYAVHELLNRPVPSNTQEILEWMVSEKIVNKSTGNGYSITNFGAIAAARDLNKFEDLTRKVVRIIRYKGFNKVVTEQEFSFENGYAIGFNKIIQFLSFSLPQSEIIEKAFRRKVPVYPEIALRELAANMLIHQDFTVSGMNPMIEMYDDRIEFTNPGSLLPSKSIFRLIGTPPESRNELLAAAFRRYNLCEERGSGFTKTIQAIELFGLPPLGFDKGENYFKVILYFPRDFSKMSRTERIQACYQHAVIKHLSSGTMTNKSLRERFKMSEKQRAMISRLIKEAIDEGFIKIKSPESKAPKNAEYTPSWI